MTDRPGSDTSTAAAVVAQAYITVQTYKAWDIVCACSIRRMDLHTETVEGELSEYHVRGCRLELGLRVSNTG
ncbi:MAG: hypothetical protein KAY24_16495 [Candidatus Eisenbacteria sp.]|nr:hypothetical protein [Candidatus Eisenbacteria bacterium]